MLPLQNALLKSESDVIGKRAEDLFPPDLAETYRKQDIEVLQTGQEFSDRLELISNRDGSLGWYLASKFALNNDAGEIIGLISISRDLQTPSTGDLKMAGLQRVSEWVRNHLEEDLSVATLSKIAGMTAPQLERKMKRVFKLGAAAYVRKVRIENAARLLRETDLSITEIALQCGYSEQSSLTRQFKATVGNPPAKYRASHQA